MTGRRVLLSLHAVLLSGCLSTGPAYYPRSSDASVMPVSRHARPAAPELRRLPNGHYRVRKPWTVNLNGRTWLVQRGYTSNGITGPKRIKESLGDGVDHPETWAAVFHDWLFTQPGVSRAMADSLFRDVLVAYGVPSEKVRLMHASVAAYSIAKAVR